MKILEIEEGQSFEVRPAFSNSFFWFTTDSVTPGMVTLHESDCSSQFECETSISDLENLIKSKTYEDQYYWYEACMSYST